MGFRAARTLFTWLLPLAAGHAVAQVSATINVDTANAIPLNANFSGFNDEVVFPAEFFDYRANNLAAQLSPGWVRYPSGLFSQAFDWQSGRMVPSWVAQFAGADIETLLSQSVAWVNGKGGGSFADAANRANFLNAKLIVSVNAYTDTPQSAGKMAAFAKANQIPVAVWELANEPYLYSSFFSSGADYVAKMKPYYTAIKTADPNAVVAIYFTDAGNANPNPFWDQSIANYADKYWDAVTYHHYPPLSAGAFSQWMADENAVLASKTSDYATNHVAKLSPGKKLLISEFGPSNDGLGTDASLTGGTLYGAIYSAEYVMRMSTVPGMLYVGMHALTGTRGVYAATAHYNNVQSAFNAGTAIDTMALNFGFYFTAQPLGLAVLNGVVRNATMVNATTLTGGATVPATGLGTIPALYAQAYTSATGQRSVVITNKSATAHQAALQVNGTAVSGSLAIQFIGGSDPATVNTPANAGVSVQSATSANPVTVPAYGVLRVDLNSPAAVVAANSASYAAGVAAPQEIVALFGPGVAAQTALATLPLPTSLGGTSVQITDSAGNPQFAPLFAVSPSQASILIPAGMAAGPAKITVLHGPAPALTGSLTIAGSAPGLYSMNSDGAGVAAANAFLYSASNQVTKETAFTLDNPAVARSYLPLPLGFGGPGDTLYVSLYGTGIRGAASVQCFVAGVGVPVSFWGPVAADPGLDQVNISIPRSLAGSGRVRVWLVADGAPSNAVALNLQ